MEASQLRDLARRYASGQLERQEYREARRKLIEEIVAGRIELHQRQSDPRDDNRPGHDSRWQRLGLVLLLGLLLAAFAVYFLGDRDRADEGPATTPSATPATALIAGFISDDDWSETALERLESEWRTVDAFQREIARRDHRWQALRRATTRRLPNAWECTLTDRRADYST